MPYLRMNRVMRGSLAFAAQAALLALATVGAVNAAQDDATDNAAYRSCQSPPDPHGLAVGLERRCPAIGGSSGIARGDFNGDGIGDLAIGAPGEDLPGSGSKVTLADAGVVHVIYGTAASGLVASATGVPTTQLLRQPQIALVIGTEIAESGDQFGSSLAAGDFDFDGYSDLAVGVSQERTSGTTARGVVQVFRGSSAGLATTASAIFGPQLFSEVADPQSSRGANSLTWGDFNGDTFGDLAVGSYGVNALQSTQTYDRVTVLYGSGSGLTTKGVQQFVGSNFLAATTNELPTVLSAGDFNADGKFDLAIGSPRETLDGILLAGVVTVVYGSASGLDGAGRQLWHANVANVPTIASQGDQFGSAVATGTMNGDRFADLAIGIQGEDIGTSSSAGAVVVLYGSGTGLQAPATGNVAQLWTQASSSVFGPAELNDYFGSALTTGDFDGNGVKDLAIGVPGEDLTGGNDAGIVNVIYGTSSGLSVTLGTSPRAIAQSSFGDPVETGDQFGATLSAWNFGLTAQADLAIGAPLEDVGTLVDAGAMFVIYGGTSGLKNVQTWTQNSTNVPDVAEAGDQFGKAAY